MTTRLDRLAADAYPTEEVDAAVFARHERSGAKLALLLGGPVFVVFGMLGWPFWLAGAIAGGVAGAAYSLMGDNYVLVLSWQKVRLHRPPKVWWFRVPLGSFERLVDVGAVHAERKGLFNDVWEVDGIEMLINKRMSARVTAFLARHPPPPPDPSTRLA